MDGLKSFITPLEFAPSVIDIGFTSNTILSSPCFPSGTIVNVLSILTDAEVQGST